MRVRVRVYEKREREKREKREKGEKRGKGEKREKREGARYRDKRGRDRKTEIKTRRHNVSKNTASYGQRASEGDRTKENE